MSSNSKWTDGIFKISSFLQIFYAEPRRGEAYGASEGSSEKFAPLLHPHMNIVYITIYYLAASERKCFPYFMEYGIIGSSPVKKYALKSRL